MNPLPREEECRIEPLVSAISGRWKLLVIYWLAQRTFRFNELQRNLGGITHRTLKRQLSELQEAGFVVRKDFKSIPPHVEYSLSPLGQCHCALNSWTLTYWRGFGRVLCPLLLDIHSSSSGGLKDFLGVPEQFTVVRSCTELCDRQPCRCEKLGLRRSAEIRGVPL